MVKGRREGEGNVIGGGEVDDMEEQGSRSFARADLVWVVVDVEAPPIIDKGWEGMASSARWGPRGTMQRPGRQRGRLRWRAVHWRPTREPLSSGGFATTAGSPPLL